jgi:hypothetical protein
VQEVMAGYERETSNRWRPSDAAAYEKVKHVPTEKVTQAIIAAKARAASRPVSDVEDGHISTASCILANLSMRVGRPSVYDPQKRMVVNDTEATSLLSLPYRSPWIHPTVAII